MKEGWEIKKLGEVCTKLTDGSHNPPKGIQHSNYVMLSSQNIFNDKVIYDDVRFLQEADFLREDKRTCVQEGDILLTIVGTIGRCAVFTGSKNVTLQRSVAVLRPQENVFPRYLMYCLIGKNASLNEEAHGIAQKGIYLKQLSQVIIPIPSITEQEKIVAELDCLSGIIEKKKQQLKEYDALAQSIFYEMFGDPVENDKGWDISYLKEIAEFKNGLNFKKVENGRKQLFLGVSNFKDNSIINQIEEYSSINIADDITEEFLLKDNDIVFVRSNGSKELVGRNIIVYTGNEKITYSGFCIRCRIISSVIIPIFLNYMLSVPSIKQVIKNFGRGANISNLNQTMLGQIKVIVPPLTLQQYYISKIEAIEKQKELIKKSIEEVETLFNSRMNEYFN